MNGRRNTTRRDLHRRQLAQHEPPCGICGQPIDYTLPHLDPLAFVADHVIPLNRGGADTLENKQAAHRQCNRAKSDKLPTDHVPITPLRTSRAW